MPFSLRFAIFACILAGCQAKVEVTTTTDNTGPNPPVALQLPGARPPVPAPRFEDEKDGAVPLGFKAATGADWSDVKPGDAVRLIGVCTGLKGGAVEIVGAGRSYGQRPALAAADLSRDFSGDEKTADQKYKGRQFTVEGVCVAVRGGALRVSGSKRAAAPAGENPRLKDALSAKAEAQFTAEDIITKKVDLTAHRGKVIEVTGAVHTLSLGTCNGCVVGLGRFDEKGQPDSSFVQCLLLEQEPWRRLTYDQTVTIRGKLDHGGPITNMSACVVVKESPAPAPKVTAEELAREYKKDKKVTDDKYRVAPGAYTGKSLVLVGEVLDWNRDGSGKYVRLKGADGTTVCCYPAPGALFFPEFEAPAGAKVELVARYGTFGTADTVWTNLGLIRVLK